MDGEQCRALLAAVMWSSGTSTERKAKSPNTFLPTADDLLKRSLSMGSPYASDSADVVLVDPTPFSAIRLREWLLRQSPDVQAVVLEAVQPPPQPTP